MRCMALAVRPCRTPRASGRRPTAPSLRLRCQAGAAAGPTSRPVMQASSTSSSLARNGGRCSSSQARSSSRNFSSSGARAKSTIGRVAAAKTAVPPGGPGTLSPKIDSPEGAGTGDTDPSSRRVDCPPSRAAYTVANSTDATPGEAVDFTFDDEQLALQDVARRAMGEVDGATLRELADDPVGITPALWDRWSTWAGPGCWSRGARVAGLLEMCIVLEQMGRVPLPGPFFSSSVMATLAARALGADELLAGLASGLTPGHRGPARAGPRRTRWAPSGPGPAARAPDGW